jgi:flagellar basal-body rod protein FlgF
MDDFIYVAMTGAKEAQVRQSVTSHNLANAATVGFKATMAGAVDVGIAGPGYDEARVYSLTEAQGADLTPGPIQPTGRELDVAVDGPGWIAVQGGDGLEAYTRAGALRIDPYGQLLTAAGQPVIGEGGPIAVPEYEALAIGHDGTISIQPSGQQENTLVVVDRIRLVDPPPADLRRGEDGLMRLAGGATAVPDAAVGLISQALEGSNVNMVASLVEMIENSRAFEMHIKMLTTAEDLDQASINLLRLT